MQLRQSHEILYFDNITSFGTPRGISRTGLPTYPYTLFVVICSKLKAQNVGFVHMLCRWGVGGDATRDATRRNARGEG